MKYVLILYICQLSTGECPSNNITMHTFETHKDCVLSGYRISHNTFKDLEQMEDFEKNFIEREKVVIKFECKGLQASTT